MALFILDFDLTIASNQTHKLIVEQIISGAHKLQYTDENDYTSEVKEQQWSFVESVEPIAFQHNWRDTIEHLIASGHQVAIASFNAFGHIIPRYLIHKLELSPNLINPVALDKSADALTHEQKRLINTVSWLPDEPSTADKNLHIEQLIRALQFPFDPHMRNVVLVDDSLHNIIQARKKYRAIHVDPVGNFFQEIRDLCLELKSSQEANHKMRFLSSAMSVLASEDEVELPKLNRLKF